MLFNGFSFFGGGGGEDTRFTRFVNQPALIPHLIGVHQILKVYTIIYFSHYITRQIIPIHYNRLVLRKNK